jgi:hypothetical protein
VICDIGGFDEVLKSFCVSLKGNCLGDTLFEDPHNSFNIFIGATIYFEQKLWRKIKAVLCSPVLIATSLVVFNNYMRSGMLCMHFLPCINSSVTIGVLNAC